MAIEIFDPIDHVFSALEKQFESVKYGLGITELLQTPPGFALRGKEHNYDWHVVNAAKSYALGDADASVFDNIGTLEVSFYADKPVEVHLPYKQTYTINHINITFKYKVGVRFDANTLRSIRNHKPINRATLQDALYVTDHLNPEVDVKLFQVKQSKNSLQTKIIKDNILEHLTNITNGAVQALTI